MEHSYIKEESDKRRSDIFMSLRRCLLIAAAVILIISLAAGVALAKPPWASAGKGKEGQMFQQQFGFPDVPHHHWAHGRIRAMIMEGVINGYPDGFFRPNAPIKRIEALAMILRIAEDVEDETIADAIYGGEGWPGIPGWAESYIAIALEEGIITEDELPNFRPMQAAKRYEVAMLLARALGYDDDDAQEAVNDEDFNFDFKDIKAVPEEALGYVYLMCDEGYFVGHPNGLFQPNKPVTRAEMATILSRVSELEDIDVEIAERYKVKGVIVDLEDKELTLRVRGKERSFDVDPDEVIVFIDGEESDYGELLEGYVAVVIFNSDNEAMVIYARSVEGEEEEEIS